MGMLREFELPNICKSCMGNAKFINLKKETYLRKCPISGEYFESYTWYSNNNKISTIISPKISYLKQICQVCLLGYKLFKKNKKVKINDFRKNHPGKNLKTNNCQKSGLTGFTIKKSKKLMSFIIVTRNIIFEYEIFKKIIKKLNYKIFMFKSSNTNTYYIFIDDSFYTKKIKNIIQEYFFYTKNSLKLMELKKIYYIIFMLNNKNCLTQRRGRLFSYPPR